MLTMCILLLCFLAMIHSGTSLTCLSCDAVISPRHCQTIFVCNENEICAVEKFRNHFDEEMFNVGCRPKTHCNSALRKSEIEINNDKRVRSMPITCTECCHGDLCNAAGCGEQGFPKNRGPACYNCLQSRITSKCDTVDVCAIDEVCHVQLNEQFGERFYSTSCVSQSVCHANNGHAIFGKRSSLRMVCEKCCSNDLCNSNCGDDPISTEPITTTATQMTTETTTVPTTTRITTTPSSTESNEFWVAFPENYRTQPDSRWYLALYITSKRINKETTVKILQDGKMTPYRFNKSLTIDIDRQTQLRENIIETKGIRIVSDNIVSVVGYSTYNYYLSDAFHILPIDRLGTSYVIVSYHPYSIHKSFVSILAVHSNTTIDITLNTTNAITYNGNTYHSNDTFTLHMDQYQTFQLSHVKDLTGTYIKSSKPIVVQSGCSLVHYPGYDNNYYSVFLPPVPEIGMSYIIPIFLTAYKTSVRIVPVTSSTDLTMTYKNNTTTRYILDKTLEIDVPISQPTLILCSKPCLVAAYSYNSLWNLMTLIPSVSQYSQNFTYVTPHDTFFNYTHYVSVIIKSSDVDSLMIDDKPVSFYRPTSDTVLLNGESWSVIEVNVNRGTHSITSVKNTRYTVIAYGFRSYSAYAFPVDMKHN